MTHVNQSEIGSAGRAVNRLFSEPVTDLEPIVPNAVFRALLTHCQHRIDTVYTKSVNSPVPALVLLSFGIQLVTPVITKIIIEVYFEVFQTCF